MLCAFYKPYTTATFSQETGAKVQIEPKQSWFKRLFRRSKKGERSAPYLVQPKENMKIVRSESDPELSASKSPPAGQVDGNRNEGEAKPQRRKAKTTKSSRQTKALSTAFEHITPVPITGMAIAAITHDCAIFINT